MLHRNVMNLMVLRLAVRMDYGFVVQLVRMGRQLPDHRSNQRLRKQAALGRLDMLEQLRMLVLRYMLVLLVVVLIGEERIQPTDILARRNLERWLRMLA